MGHSGRRVAATIVLGILVAATGTPVVGVAVDAGPAGLDSPEAATTDAYTTTDTTVTFPTNDTRTATDTATTDASRTTDTAERAGPVNVTRQEGVEIAFACDAVRVSVPEGTAYTLVVHYFVAETGEYDQGFLGPLEGTVEEPFDDEIVFFEVNVVVGGAVVASGFIPESCPNAPGLALV